jgi:hypothetical protein
MAHAERRDSNNAIAYEPDSRHPGDSGTSAVRATSLSVWVSPFGSEWRQDRSPRPRCRRQLRSS